MAYLNIKELAMNQPRIAWLLTSGKQCWHPTLSHFAKYYPQTIVFAPNWPGYAVGFENSFAVEPFPMAKILHIKKLSANYGSNVTYLPLNIVHSLFRFKPDLIFANSFGIWTILALLLKPMGKWKVVIAYEGSTPSVDYRNSKARLLLRRLMVKLANACITNTRAGKAYLTEVVQALPEKVFVQPYQLSAAISLSLNLTNTKVNFSQLQRPVFLFVGKIIARKGLHLLLEACNLLEKQGCRQYTLLIIGEGSQLQELKTFIKNNGLDDRVKWAGRVDYSNLGGYYTQSEVFVFPSLEDTIGMVVQEAMLFSKPVICSKWAGSAEFITEGENGYCLDPNETETLAKLMHHFIINPELTVSMGNKSKQLIATYTPENAAKFLCDVTNFVFKN
jgi:glycosyltransferase involved in cell wall biosynthesis